MISLKFGEVLSVGLPVNEQTLASLDRYLAEVAKDFNAVVSTRDADLHIGLYSFTADTYNGFGGSNFDFTTRPALEIVRSKLISGTGYGGASQLSDMNIGLSANITDLIHSTIQKTGKVNKLDVGYSTLMHEFAHVLGFYSVRNPETGVLTSPFPGVFDTNVIVTQGAPYYIGKTATLLYGGNVPLHGFGASGTSNSHFAITTSTGADTGLSGNELMKGYGTGKETYIGYSGMDLAVFKDLGYNVTSTMVSADQHRYIPGSLTTSITATPALSDKLLLEGNRNDYSLAHVFGSVTVLNKATKVQYSLKEMDAVSFKDMSIDLNVAKDATSIPFAQLGKLVNLYIAFFNRVPDGAGLDYWIRDLKAGATMDSIANNFYRAGVEFSAQTGYTASMTNQDFVKQVYAIVLGRSDKTQAPDAAGLSYWTGELNSGSSTKAGLVGKMIDAAYTYRSDQTWGWVPRLLDNKMTVGLEFAVGEGIFYADPVQSIVKTMAIAQAVTPTDMTAALALIGVNDTAWDIV